MTDLTTDLATIDGTETAALIRDGEITASEAIEAAISRAESLQPELNFMVSDTFERARERAVSEPLSGRFAGVPYLVKDMYDVEGVPTRWGARFGQFLPAAPANSTQVDAMEGAGLVVIGKSALNEIGYLPTCEPLASGATLSPWDASLSPGGSSGGAAVAVASGVVPMADAADGGGSIRIPASACGLFGLKPSGDRLVGQQELAAGHPLTAEHCVTRSVRDSAGLFAAMERVGADAVLAPVGEVSGPSTRRLRVGVQVASLGGRQPDNDVTAALDDAAGLLEDLGHRVEPTKLPFDGGAMMEHFWVIWTASAGQVIEMAKSVLGTEPDDSVLEPFTLAMADHAANHPADAVDAALKHLVSVGPQYDAWFDDFDVILSPVLLSATVPVGHIHGAVPMDELRERLTDFADFTPLHNAVGAPAMSVPLAWSDSGLPIGSHFAARVGDERTLFELAFELEQARPWSQRRPPIFASGVAR